MSSPDAGLDASPDGAGGAVGSGGTGAIGGAGASRGAAGASGIGGGLVGDASSDHAASGGGAGASSGSGGAAGAAGAPSLDAGADATSPPDASDDSSIVPDGGSDATVADGAPDAPLASCSDADGGVTAEIVLSGLQLPKGLDVAPDGLVWIDDAAPIRPCSPGCALVPGEVLSLPAGQSAPIVLATGLGLERVARGPGVVHYTDAQGASALLPPTLVGMVPLDGSQAATTFDVTQWAPGLAADDLELFVVEQPGPWEPAEVVRIPVGSFATPGNWARSAPFHPGSYVLDTALDATDLYVTNRNVIFRVSRSSLAVVEVAQLSDNVGSLAVDDVDMYFATGTIPPPLGTATASTVYRLDKQGAGTPAVLASDQPNASFVAVDDTHVYWVNHVEPCSTILRLAKVGGTPEVVVSGEQQISSLALDATFVWFTTLGPPQPADPGAPPPVGAIKRVAK